MTHTVLETPYLAALANNIVGQKFLCFDVVKRQPILRSDANAFLELALLCSAHSQGPFELFLPSDDADSLRSAQICGLHFVGYLCDNNFGKTYELWDGKVNAEVLSPFEIAALKLGIRRTVVECENEVHQQLEQGSLDWIKYAKSRERFFAGIRRPTLALEVETPLATALSGEDTNAKESAPANELHLQSSDSLSNRLLQRRSATAPKKELVSQATVRKIIHGGFKLYEGSPTCRRPFPSAGGLYATKIVVVMHEENSVNSALYLCDHFRNFQKMDNGIADLQAHVMAMLNQPGISNWRARIFVCADTRPVAEKYGARAYRNLFIEAGCILQNLHLLAGHEGLNSRVITGLDDLLIERLLGQNEYEMALGALVLG